MAKIALFPGTFDPPSLGHLDIIKKGGKLADRLIVAIATKPEKAKGALFNLNEKLEMLKAATQGFSNVEVTSFQGLAVDFAKEKKVSFFLRGLRAFSDFEAELQMALANRRLSGIETVFLLADEKYTHISSSLIREILYFNGPVKDFVPEAILPFLTKVKKPAQG